MLLTRSRAFARAGQAEKAALIPLDQEMGAVDDVDQMGDMPDMREQGEMGANAMSGEMSMGPGMGILEHWMEQVEGDPSYLLRNQFMLEEAQYMRSRGGPARETRPW